MISLSEAATATGVHKVTILRSIQKGKVSATKDAHGEWQIDPAELHRVYKPAAEQRNTGDDSQPYATAALEAQIAGLKAVNELLRQECDRWHAQAERLALAPPAPVPAPARSWWRRAG